MDNTMVEYLQMIQNTVSRMSTASALFKGFTATIVAGFIAITFNQYSIAELLLPLLIVAGFISMDVYYLQLERRFRFLYEEVRNKEHPVDFSLEPPEVKSIADKDPNNKSRVKLSACIFTRSILLFYGPVLIAYILLLACKCCQN